MRSTLTENAIRAAEPNTTLWDGSTKHFGLRVYEGGQRSFIVLLASGRRLVIGQYPIISLKQARDKARMLLAEKTLGRFQPQTIVWDTALEKFLEYVEANNRPRTHKEYSRVLKKYFGFGTARLVDISRRDIIAKLDKLNKVPAQKSRALTYCKTFFNWCINEQGYLEHSPCRMSAQKSKKRKRVLTDEELKRVWIAADQCGTFGMIVRLLMLTGQRRSEIAGLQRSFYSHNQQTVCLPDWLTKNGLEHTFPLVGLAGKIVSSCLSDLTGTTFLFPARGNAQKPFSGWSKSKKALDKICPMAHWTLHDLRRTFRTNLGRLGVSPHIAERLVNHVSHRSEMEETYDLWKYLPQMRQAMENYDTFLLGIFRDQ